MTLNEIYDRGSESLTSHSERIKFLGWYLHVHRDKPRFTQTDIRNCYDEVNIEKPASLAPWFQEPLRTKAQQLLRDGDGYRLERSVRDHYTKEFGGKQATERQTTSTAKALEVLAAKVLDVSERSFIEEAITCINHRARDAAIVWLVRGDPSSAAEG